MNNERNKTFKDTINQKSKKEIRFGQKSVQSLENGSFGKRIINVGLKKNINDYSMKNSKQTSNQSKAIDIQDS